MVELADHLGRDYTTVSRREKLEARGLACKQPNRHDRRISEVTLSASGQQMIDSIAVARRRLMNQVLAQWPEDEVQALFRLTRKYADSLQQRAKFSCVAARRNNQLLRHNSRVSSSMLSESISSRDLT